MRSHLDTGPWHLIPQSQDRNAVDRVLKGLPENKLSNFTPIKTTFSPPAKSSLLRTALKAMKYFLIGSPLSDRLKP
ncbi:hypothetical protein [uncultured Nostoc sp.]|uniref:hypothetical protein n=1 Tax=uncultured Nostoc sp. TaxID=340711 RepID=UPI0035CA5B9A